MSNIVLVTEHESADEVRAQSGDMLTRAQALVITTSSDYATAGLMLRGIAGIAKQVKDHHRPMKDAANKAHKAITQAEAGLLGPLEEAKALLTQKRFAHEAVEQRRVEALAAQATEQRQSVAEDEADVFGGPVAVVAPVTIAAVLPEVIGVSKRKRWVAVLDDKAAFVASALERHKAGDSRYLDMVEVTMTELHAFARLDREHLTIPGVRAEEIVTEAVRG